VAGFDVVIVGGGTAGCVLAARLSEDSGRSVCLLEAGPDYGPLDGGGWPAEMVDAHVMPETHDWGSGGEDDRTLGARIIGGCSTHNACMVVEGTPSDYDEWGPEWSYARFAPYLERAKAALRTARANTDAPAPLHVAFVEATRRSGFPLLTDPNDAAQPVGIAPFRANVVGTARWNTAFAYLDAARGRPNLTVVPGSLVDRVLLDGRRTTGVVTADGRELGASLVVLAAGAYFSPAILQRSGIGPEAGLRRLGIPVVTALPVGDDLLDHCGAGLGWRPSEQLQAETSEHVRQSGGLFEAHTLLKAASSSCPVGSFDLHLHSWVGTTDEPGRHSALMAVFLMKPLSRGCVRLRSTDPHELPLVERNFLHREEDLLPLLEGFELARALAATAPLDGLLEEELLPGPVDLAGFLRENVRNYFHPAGTCGMGRVVDPAGRVLGMEGLVVADASIMPTIPRANTNLTTAAIAERLAETL
jgi:choline dehydrogenase